LATKAALRSQHSTTRVGAVALYGHSVVSIASNLPSIKKPDYIKHAEVRAVRKAGHVDTIYVARLGKAGALLDSYPCPMCLAFLKAKGVKKVVYLESGKVKRERI